MNKLIPGFLLVFIVAFPASANQYLEQLQNLSPVSNRPKSDRVTAKDLADSPEVSTSIIYDTRMLLLDFKYDELAIVCGDDRYHNHIRKQSCKTAINNFAQLDNSIFYGMSITDYSEQANKITSYVNNFRALCRTNKWCK